MPKDLSNKRRKYHNAYVTVGGLILVAILIVVVVVWARGGVPGITDNAKTILTLEKGTTFVKPDIDSDWQIASNDYELKEGYHVKVSKGSIATVTFANENVARLSNEGEIVLENVPEAKDDLDVTVKLLAGNIWNNVYTAEDKEANYLVTTEAGTVKAVGTVFNVDRLSKLKTACYSLDKEVDLKAKKNNEEINPTKIKSGYASLIDSKNLPKSKTKALKTAKINRNVLDSYWFKWNALKDQEYYAKIGCEDKCKDETGIYIYHPKNGATTTRASVEVKGSTMLGAIVKVNGKKVKNSKGFFKTTVKIKKGKNTIKVVSTKDDKTSTKTLTVTRVEKKVVKASTLSGSATSSGNRLSWTKNGDSDFSFYKVLRSTSTSSLSYPTHNYVAISNQSYTSYTDTSVTNGTTYYYRIATVGKSGSVAYSNVVSVKATKESEEEEEDPGWIGFAASYCPATQKVDCAWTKYDGSKFQYYKIVASSTNPYPSYPSPGQLIWASSNINTTNVSVTEGCFTGCGINIAPCPGDYSGWVYIRIVVLLEGGNKVNSNVVRLYIP
ncbi:FecR domain-containing protein [Patescibacteria group bacterium]